MIDHIKLALALLGAAMGGLILGVTVTARMAYQPVPLADPPPWMGEAEQLLLVAGIGLAAAAAAWMYVDYRYEVAA